MKLQQIVRYRSQAHNIYMETKTRITIVWFYIRNKLHADYYNFLKIYNV